MQSITILDSTLRDGAQGNGISFSLEDKLNVVQALDALGVDLIEAGNPGSNPKDIEFFQRAAELHLCHAKIAAFGSTRRKGIPAEEDANLQALLRAGTEVVVIFGKCWKLHVDVVLQTTEEENLKMIEDSCRYLHDFGKTVIFDAEHFYDGYRDDPEYALLALQAAVRGGAHGLVLCDTNGGIFPDEAERITREVVQKMDIPVGVHFHDDGGMAVANSVCGVQAGAVQVQGTFLGFGERCGNANLATVIANLQLKRKIECIPPENMVLLTSTAKRIAEAANIQLPESEPYVGRSAFAHKAGMHADGVLKESRSFEHIGPEQVGNERRFLASEMAGRAIVLKKINRLYPELTRESPEIARVMERLKELEYEGYQFEGADASFELMVRKCVGTYKPYFDLIHYKIISGCPSEEGCSASATVKIRVGDQTQLMAAEGNGPVHALDQAIRSALEVFYPCLNRMRLVDYKVRVMDAKSATASLVRVLISSTEGRNVWTTVGVSCDVVQASWVALVDSIEYMLFQTACENKDSASGSRIRTDR